MTFYSTSSSSHENDAYRAEQAQRARDLFATAILCLIDDAIMEDSEVEGLGQYNFRTWAKSRHGQTLLRYAGFEANDRTIDGLIRFIQRGKKTTVALTETARHQKVQT